MQVEYHDYIFLKLEQTRLKDLAYIYKSVYQAELTEEELADKHLFTHGDNKFIGFLAYHKPSNEAVAFYAIYPVYINYQGEKKLVAQSGDTMTNPNHQKKGLFVELARTTNEYAKDIGITIIFGFPNNNSYTGLIRLGYTELPPLENFQLLENKFEFYRFTSKNTLLNKLHKRYIKFVLSILSKKGIEFQNSNSQSHFPLAYILHDETYFKLKSQPNKQFIRIYGVDIWLKISGNIFTIGDISFNNPEKIHSVIKRLKLIARLAGYRFLTIGGSNNSVISKFFRDLNIKKTDSFKPFFLSYRSDIPFKDFSFIYSDIDVF